MTLPTLAQGKGNKYQPLPDTAADGQEAGFGIGMGNVGCQTMREAEDCFNLVRADAMLRTFVPVAIVPVKARNACPHMRYFVSAFVYTLVDVLFNASSPTYGQ